MDEGPFHGVKNVKGKPYLAEGYAWQDYTKDTHEHYRHAMETGDLTASQGHHLAHGAELELKFAMDLARVYLAARPAGTALDVACGGGYITDCLTRLGFDAIGFDILREGVEFARRRYPGIEFFQGDGTAPKKYFHIPKFDFVLMREFHPFTRVDDFDYQLGIILDYLDILRNGGLLALVHARRPDCDSLDFKKLERHFAGTPTKTAGPLYFFPHRHLRIPPRLPIVNRFLSGLARAFACVAKKYPVEFFLIRKPVGCGSAEHVRRGGTGRVE